MRANVDGPGEVGYGVVFDDLAKVASVARFGSFG